MEPADQRREHPARSAAPSSPSARAAMEPADQRREHLERGNLDPGAVVAAMEPADQRREHTSGRSPRLRWYRAPQWSPPTSGGSTQVHGQGEQPDDGAAMEPADQRREHSTTSGSAA